MVLCDSEALISKIRDLRDYDNREDSVLRFNYKMTDIQAALGKNQLNHIEEFIGRRRKIASRFIQEFKDLPLALPLEKAQNWHLK